jgi:hypothetical protein
MIEFMQPITELLSTRGVSGTVKKNGKAQHVMVYCLDRQGYKKSLEGSITNLEEAKEFKKSFMENIFKQNDG